MDRVHEWEFAKNYEQFRIRKTCEGKAAIRVQHPGVAHMWKCIPGLPDWVGVDVPAGSVLTWNH